MNTFTTIRGAKEFLVGRIVEEASRNGIPLSDVEEKMMYFSETGWTLEGMYELNASFEIEYDQAEYEEKIAQLIRSLKASDRRRESEAVARWKAAEALLRTEDHYLLVLIDLASGRTSRLREPARPYRFFTLLMYGFVGFIVCWIALIVAMRTFR